MSKKSDDKKQNVVLVGGGYANIHVVNALEKTLDRTRFNLVLVNPRPYYLHQVSALRMVTVADEQLVKDSLIPYDRLPGVTLVEGKAVAIEEAAPGKGGAGAGVGSFFLDALAKTDWTLKTLQQK